MVDFHKALRRIKKEKNMAQIEVGAKNGGLIFRNTSDNPKSPALSGFITNEAGDKLADVACWYVTDRDTNERKLDKSGNPYLSIKISEVRKQS